MKKENILSLSGAWKMRRADTSDWHAAQVPGSVYADLMRDGTLPDPFWRENELQFFELMKHDFIYERSFSVPAALLSHSRVELCCDGLDTIAEITVNGQPAGHADNMHIAWRFDVKELLREGENEISVRFDSSVNYVLGEYEKRPCWGSSDAIPGFGALRKPHMMFGWDWGPRLPDAGIWKDIRIEGVDVARLEGVRVEQVHEEGKVTLILHPEIDGDAAACSLDAVLTAPDGSTTAFKDNKLTVEKPELWWPNGFGAQPLYRVDVTLKAACSEHDRDGIPQAGSASGSGVQELGACDTVPEDGGDVLDTWTCRIGLRTLSVSREKDAYGEEFCHIVNGVKIFAMGADYIPEDNIYSRITPERTRRLLEDAVLANFNSVRVWGGGYYPSDDFYDICDELGLLVWQDLMYACSYYDLTPEFEASIRTETVQNVRRIRNHASLALICGNNEMESFMAVANHQLETDFAIQGSGFERHNTRRSHVADYILMYSYILPEIVKKEAPQTFWWPSSPSSGGNFDNPQDPSRGDVHYWDVWHGEKPFTEYRKFNFRYVSEFGFQSFPCLATVESFTEPDDRNIFSRVMERHQRNKSANGKILAYMAQTFRYPNGFDHLLYASQLLQAEAIRYGVEYWRRNRGCCMGAIIWQLNDCWPVASWASIDYYGRWKALHYAAKRFFAPIMISVHEEGEVSQNPQINEFRTEPIEKSAHMCIANETMRTVRGTVRWSLRNAKAEILQQGETAAEVQPLSSFWLEKLCFPEAVITESYFSCEFADENGEVLSRSTALFVAPKHFDFEDPELTVQASQDGKTVTVCAKAYARSIRIESDDPDLLLSDNFFDMDGGMRSVEVLRGSASGLRVSSVYDIG